MRSIFAALTAATLLAVAGIRAQAQQAAPAPRPPPAPGPAPTTAAPPENAGMAGLGEIMTLQQLRHIKLWFAGSAGNWPLADYELGELNEGFEDVNRLLGGDTVEQMVGGPMKALQKIVDSKDHARFAAAYDRLSAGCNSCHHTLDHAFIAIRRPTLLPYGDQSFEPQK